MTGMEVHFDGHCFGCGQLNLEGLRMVFTPVPGGAVAEYMVPERYQSWAGMVHGGVMALMLDEAVGWAGWHAGHPGVTGRLQVSYRRPLNVGETVRVVGQVERVRRTLVYCSAFIESRDAADRIADATATLMMTDTKIDPDAGAVPSVGGGEPHPTLAPRSGAKSNGTSVLAFSDLSPSQTRWDRSEGTTRPHHGRHQ